MCRGCGNERVKPPVLCPCLCVVHLYFSDVSIALPLQEVNLLEKLLLVELELSHEDEMERREAMTSIQRPEAETGRDGRDQKGFRSVIVG